MNKNRIRPFNDFEVHGKLEQHFDALGPGVDFDLQPNRDLFPLEGPLAIERDLCPDPRAPDPEQADGDDKRERRSQRDQLR
jgi:hypothetical protein